MSMYRTYTETYDLNTEKDCPTLLGIHTPIGPNPRKFLEPCFRMYKKYKYNGCDITIVNSAKLPVDPEQIGRIEGTNYVDPRDTLNPIMFKGCHGESLGKVLDSMYGGLASAIFKDPSIDKEVFRADLEHFYYTALGDDTWRKSPVQKTLNIRNLHPLVYGLASQHQIDPTNDMNFDKYSMNNAPDVEPRPVVADIENGEVGIPSADNAGGYRSPIVLPTKVYDPADGSYKFKQQLLTMFTNKVQKLGWMDTLQFIGQVGSPENPSGYSGAQVAMLPKIFMGLLMLPPAYLCRQYLRVIIRHKFMFKQYRSITTAGINEDQWNPANFTLGYANEMTGNTPATPTHSVAMESDRSPGATKGASGDVAIDMEDEPDESE